MLDEDQEPPRHTVFTISASGTYINTSDGLYSAPFSRNPNHQFTNLDRKVSNKWIHSSKLILLSGRKTKYVAKQ